MPEFHETRMGVRFYESQVPEAVDALKTIGKALAALAAEREVVKGAVPPESSSERDELTMDLDGLVKSLVAGVMPKEHPPELREALRDAEAIVGILRRLNA